MSLLEVRPFPHSAARKTFTGDLLEHDRIKLKYYRRGEDGPLVAHVAFGRRAEGAPGRAHGGAVLTVLDEAMGAACWIKGWPVFTARISAAFRRGVPLERHLVVETHITRMTSRLAFVSGRLVDDEGLLYAEATGSFARLRPEQVRAAFG
ncbi:MAG: PaaI family thioesterase [Elusimicrobia bacterium]|nr:PaaI family thioesterase [Elusimicrobiota bacterium]